MRLYAEKSFYLFFMIVADTPSDVVQFGQNSHQSLYSSKQEHRLKIFWKVWVFKEQGRTQNLHFWSNLDLPVLPKDGGNQKILAVVWKKFQALGYSNMSKSRIYLLSRFCKRYNYFLHFLCCFWQETGRGHKS